MTTIAFWQRIIFLIIALALRYWLGYSDGEQAGKRACPAVAGQEVVAVTPNACMYAARLGRGIYRRVM